uniref:Uncharacterized protein n=1 Tax=Arundo donax TaxID=35708 RepID=A0A0A9DTE4_ARUDO
MYYIKFSIQDLIVRSCQNNFAKFL